MKLKNLLCFLTKKTRWFILVPLFLFSLFFSVDAQEQKNHPLYAILDSLELKYDVSFTYLEEHIQGVLVLPPPDTYNLRKTIDYLAAQTGLIFNKINKKYIAISTARQEKVLCGYLLDAISKEPIQEAIVYFHEEFVITDKNGYFKIVNTGKDSVVHVRHIGFEENSLSIFKYEENCGSYHITPKVTTLNDVLISSYITRGIDKLSGGTISLDNSKINLLPGMSETDVLHSSTALPGISSVDEKISTINIRAGSSDQNLILLEGVKVYMPGHLFGLISTINPFISKKATIIKNGTPSHLSDGVSGTININSDNEVNENLKITSSINMLSGNVQINTPINKKSALHLSYRNSYAELLKTPTYKNYFKQAFRNTREFYYINNTGIAGTQNHFFFRDVNMKLLVDISTKDKIRMGVYNFSNSLLYEERELVDGVIISKVSSLNQGNFLSNIDYQRRWNARLRTEILLYLTRYNLASINYDIYKSVRSDQINNVEDIGVNIKNLFYANNNLKYTFGVQVGHIEIGDIQKLSNPEFNIFSKEKLSVYSGYLESEYLSENEQLEIRIGLRNNYYRKFDKYTFEPRAALTYRFAKNYSFTLLGEQKNQVTSQIIDDQNDFLGVENRKWILTNLVDIPLIVSKQISSGINFQKKNMLISTEAFYKYVEGITTSSQGFQNQFEYIRAFGSYKVRGLEVLINPKIKEINIWLNYTLLNSDYVFPKLKPSTFRNNFDITHNLVFGTIFKVKKFEFSSSATIRSGTPFTKPASNIPDSTQIGFIRYNSPNSSQLPNYFRWDASIKYKFKLWDKVSGDITMSLWNINNRKNSLKTYYQINKDSVVEPIYEEGLGFVPNISLKLQLE